MATYGEVQAQLKRDLWDAGIGNSPSTDNNVSLSDNSIKTYIKDAIRKFERRGYYFNQKKDSVSLAEDANNAAVPSDFISLVEMRFNDSVMDYVIEPLDYLTVQQMRVGEVSPGRPDVVAVHGAYFEFNRDSDDDYTLPLTYVYRLAELTSDSTENGWTTEAERLIRLQAMADINFMRLRQFERGNQYQLMANEEEVRLRDHTGMRQASGVLQARYF